jgi:dolichol-phosphate mannosyltransferase
MNATALPDYSVVVPVFDEGGAAPALAREIAAAFAGENHEIIFIDDASRDDTKALLWRPEGRDSAAAGAEPPQELGPEPRRAQRRPGRPRADRRHPGRRRPERPGRRAAPGQALKAAPPELALVGGERVKRQDSSAKRLASKFGNGVRKRLLRDTANDTGCGLKAFRREAFLRLPYFDHIHRYIPALMLREGYEVAFQPVNHRHRESGVSKYTNFGRLKASVSDLLGVMWLQTRARNPQGVDEV